MADPTIKLPKRTRRGGRRRNRRRLAGSSELPADRLPSASAWPQLGSRRESDFTIATRAAPAVSDDESVCSSLTSASSASAELERPLVSRSRSSSITSDGSRSPARSRELVDGLLAARKDVSYLEIEAAQGHDAFLLPIPRYIEALSGYMNRIEVSQ